MSGFLRLKLIHAMVAFSWLLPLASGCASVPRILIHHAVWAGDQVLVEVESQTVSKSWEPDLVLDREYYAVLYRFPADSLHRETPTAIYRVPWESELQANKSSQHLVRARKSRDENTGKVLGMQMLATPPPDRAASGHNGSASRGAGPTSYFVSSNGSLAVQTGPDFKLFDAFTFEEIESHEVQAMLAIVEKLKLPTQAESYLSHDAGYLWIKAEPFGLTIDEVRSLNSGIVDVPTMDFTDKSLRFDLVIHRGDSKPLAIPRTATIAGLPSWLRMVDESNQGELQLLYETSKDSLVHFTICDRRIQLQARITLQTHLDSPDFSWDAANHRILFYREMKPSGREIVALCNWNYAARSTSNASIDVEDAFHADWSRLHYVPNQNAAPLPKDTSISRIEHRQEKIPAHRGSIAVGHEPPPSAQADR